MITTLDHIQIRYRDAEGDEVRSFYFPYRSVIESKDKT